MRHQQKKIGQLGISSFRLPFHYEKTVVPGRATDKSATFGCGTPFQNNPFYWNTGQEITVPAVPIPLRIWGEQGQAALEKSSICLLNCGPTGSETLKNLVLGGIGSVTVVDGSKVGLGDLGNNFMVDEPSVGKSKSKTLCAFLQELNDAVKAKFIEEYPEALIDSNPSSFSQFTLVIAIQLVEDSMVKLDRICRDANVLLICAHSYGLSGFVWISVKEHAVIESKPDHFLDDLRLNDPWLELKRFAESVEWDTVNLFFTNTLHMLSFLLRWQRSGQILMMAACHQQGKRIKNLRI